MRNVIIVVGILIGVALVVLVSISDNSAITADVVDVDPESPIVVSGNPAHPSSDHESSAGRNRDRGASSDRTGTEEWTPQAPSDLGPIEICSLDFQPTTELAQHLRLNDAEFVAIRELFLECASALAIDESERAQAEDLGDSIRVSVPANDPTDVEIAKQQFYSDLKRIIGDGRANYFRTEMADARILAHGDFGSVGRSLIVKRDPKNPGRSRCMILAGEGFGEANASQSAHGQSGLVSHSFSFENVPPALSHLIKLEGPE